MALRTGSCVLAGGWQWSGAERSWLWNRGDTWLGLEGLELGWVFVCSSVLVFTLKSKWLTYPSVVSSSLFHGKQSRNSIARTGFWLRFLSLWSTTYLHIEQWYIKGKLWLSLLDLKSLNFFPNNSLVCGRWRVDSRLLKITCEYKPGLFVK